MKRSARAIIITLIAIMVMSAASVSASAASSTKKATSAKFVSTNEAYTQLNNYRKKAKVATLKKDAGLEKVAKIRAEEIAKYKKFSHIRPNGQSGLSLISSKLHRGENIAMGQKDCASVSRAWYNSKGHRDNMLRKHFKKVGIACYEYNGVKFWVQMFSS